MHKTTHFQAKLAEARAIKSSDHYDEGFVVDAIDISQRAGRPHWNILVKMSEHIRTLAMVQICITYLPPRLLHHPTWMVQVRYILCT